MEFETNGGILFVGKLEKRRDGAVRGGWAMRTFILTKNTLYYFRQLDGTLLGEERGQISLGRITNVKAGSSDMVAGSAIEPGVEHYFLRISTNYKNILMRVPVAKAETCKSWVTAITTQCNALASPSSIESQSSPKTTPEPKIVAISAVGPPEYLTTPASVFCEWVISLDNFCCKWGKAIEMGHLPIDGAVIITFENGETSRVDTQVLKSCADTGTSQWIDVTAGDSDKHSVQLQVTATKTTASDKSSSSSSSSNNNTKSFIVDELLNQVEEGAAGAFLIMCFLMHLLYGVEGFHWSHKCCISIGAAMAIVSVLNGSTRRSAAMIKKAAESSTQPKEAAQPQEKYSLTIVASKVQFDGKECIYNK